MVEPELVGISLGSWELLVLMYLAKEGGEAPSEYIKNEICRDIDRANERYADCKALVKYGIIKLKKKGLVKSIRKYRGGKWYIKLTNLGKKLLLNLSLER